MSNQKPDGTSSQSDQSVNRRDLLLAGTSAVAASALGATSLSEVAQAQQAAPPANALPMGQLDRSKLPMPEPPFGGKIGKTYQDSVAEWPKLPAPPDGAPNVVIILLDDVGFGQVSTLRGARANAAARRVSVPRSAVHALSYHGHLRPLPRVPDYRSQPSQCGRGFPCRMGDGLSELQQHDPPQYRDGWVDTEIQWLLHLMVRQEPQHA